VSRQSKTDADKEARDAREELKRQRALWKKQCEAQRYVCSYVCSH
jgi:hypothetical protein